MVLFYNIIRVLSTILMAQSSTIYILNHIIDDNVYNLIDYSYVEIGKLFLNVILKKIATITLKDPSLNLLNHLFIHKCVQYLTSADSEVEVQSKSEKVYMFLGEMFVCRQFQYLHAFESEIISIIKEENEKARKLNLSQSIIVGHDQEMLQSCCNSLIEVVDLLQQRQIQIVQQTSVYGEQVSHKICEYLASVTRYRSELNYLCQMMKIPFPKVDTIRRHHYYEVKLTLSFSCIYLNKRMLQLQVIALNAYYQQAIQASYCKLLKQLYLAVPELWKDFVNLKLKKSITT